jgi:hypothetical protein
MSFHTDRYCQIHLSIHDHTTLIKNVHHLEESYGIILGSFLDIWFLVCHYIAN